DVAGIGPEGIARAWTDPRVHALARPMGIGDPAVLERAVALVGGAAQKRVDVVTAPEEADPRPAGIPCLRGAVGGGELARGGAGVLPCLGVAVEGVDLARVGPGVVDARAGRAAYEFLTTAARLAIAGRIDAITTLPLNKQALYQSGVRHPGHTEILAEYCGVT